jgi:outer membrane protein
MNKKVLKYFLLFLLINPPFNQGKVPTGFTLKQTVEYGLRHHLTIQKSDFKLAKYNQNKAPSSV